jgi:hypothetical protein
MLKKTTAWIFVTSPMREARQRLREDEATRGAALQQARLLAEIATRVADPAEPLPVGDRVPVILSLVRDAAAFVLASAAPAPNGTVLGAAPDFATAWDAAPEAVLRDAVPEAATLAATRELLTSPPPPSSAQAASGPEAVSDKVTRARAFLDRLLWNADVPRRRVEALVIKRALRLTAALAVVLLLGAAVRVVLTPKNLVEGKPMTTSSAWAGCGTDTNCEGVLLFHTNEEKEPWVEYDLLRPTDVHQIEVTNRLDCCGDRTVPLVAEVSLDRKQWTEVARKNEQFSIWSAKFPSHKARYIRFKVARVSALHLKNIEVH